MLMPYLRDGMLVSVMAFSNSLLRRGIRQRKLGKKFLIIRLLMHYRAGSRALKLGPGHLQV